MGKVVSMEEISKENVFEVEMCSDRSRYGGQKGLVIGYEDSDKPTRDTMIAIKLNNGSEITARIAACCNPNSVIASLCSATGYFEGAPQKKAIESKLLLEKAFGNGTFNVTKC